MTDYKKVLCALIWHANHNGWVPNGIELLSEMLEITGRVSPILLANCLDLLPEACREGLITATEESYYGLRITERGKRLVNGP